MADNPVTGLLVALRNAPEEDLLALYVFASTAAEKATTRWVAAVMAALGDLVASEGAYRRRLLARLDEDLPVVIDPDEPVPDDN